jgi:hypothetical protein
LAKKQLSVSGRMPSPLSFGISTARPARMILMARSEKAPLRSIAQTWPSCSAMPGRMSMASSSSRGDHDSMHVAACKGIL